jgi:hypothetical protein
MKPTLLAVLFALSFISVATSQVPSQGKVEGQLHYVAVYAGPDFNIASYGIRQVDSAVLISGPLEFRMWDIKNPSHVTLVKSRTDILYDLVTRDVKTSGEVVVSIENVPNQRTGSNRTLILPNSVNR